MSIQGDLLDEYKAELAEYKAAIEEHHRDFRRIKEIVTAALADPFEPRENALLAIDRIVR